jgi:DNA repair protein RecO (recombination protein O)
MPMLIETEKTLMTSTSKTYQVTGINLKATPFGEADRLVTILTPQHGLLRVVAPGARKPRSSLGGRSGIFVVNQLLLARGKSMDRITQAETLHTYRTLALDLSKLAISQYWAEIVLAQAMSDHPQSDLYEVLNVHLRRLDALTDGDALGHLCPLGGIAPQVHNCWATSESIVPNLGDPHWRIGFNIDRGGTVRIGQAVESIGGLYYLNAIETHLFQQLSAGELDPNGVEPADLAVAWLRIEGILRRYIKHHLGCSIRSADLEAKAVHPTRSLGRCYSITSIIFIYLAIYCHLLVECDYQKI